MTSAFPLPEHIAVAAGVAKAWSTAPAIAMSPAAWRAMSKKGQEKTIMTEQSKIRVGRDRADKAVCAWRTAPLAELRDACRYNDTAVLCLIRRIGSADRLYTALFD